MSKLIPLDEKIAEIHKSFDKHDPKEIGSISFMDGDTYLIMGCKCGCHFGLHRRWECEGIDQDLNIGDLKPEWADRFIKAVPEKWQKSLYAFLKVSLPGYEIGDSKPEFNVWDCPTTPQWGGNKYHKYSNKEYYKCPEVENECKQSDIIEDIYEIWKQKKS